VEARSLRRLVREGAADGVKERPPLEVLFALARDIDISRYDGYHATGSAKRPCGTTC
jgi:hypothetical protein